MAERTDRVKTSAGRQTARAAGRRTSERSVDIEAMTAQIERTRADVAATLAEIADRLSPERLAAEAMAEVTKAADQVDAAAETLASKALKEAESAARKLVE